MKPKIDLYPTATMFEERFEQQKAWHVFVSHARKTSKPMFYVRSPSGTTLDCVATIIEARQVQTKERLSRIYELRMTQLTMVA
jgi:hypothetical protein